MIRWSLHIDKIHKIKFIPLINLFYSMVSAHREVAETEGSNTRLEPTLHIYCNSDVFTTGAKGRDD